MRPDDQYSHKPGGLYLGLLLLYVCAVFLVYFNNHDIFKWINGLGREILRYPMLVMTLFGDGIIVLVTGGLLYKYRRGHFWPFLAAFALSGIIIQVLKTWFNAPRPLSVFENEQIFYMGEQLFVRSFPSGHSASAMVLARFLQQGAPRPLALLFFAGGVLAAVSRIYIGAHFPFDVIIGGGIGYLIAHHFHIYAAQRALHKDRPEYRKAFLGAAITGLIAALSGIFTISYRYYPLTAGLQVIFGAVALYFVYVIYDQAVKTARPEF